MNKEKLIKIVDKIIEKNGILGKYIQNFNLSEINNLGLSFYSILFKVKFPISDKMTAYFLTLQYSVTKEIQERVYFIVDDVIVDYYINFDVEKERLFDKLYEVRDEYFNFLLKDFLGE